MAAYSVAAAVTTAALLLELAIRADLSAVPFTMFLLAVAIAARYGGVGPGVVTLVVSAVLGNLFFYRPFGVMHFDLTSGMRTGFFLGIGGIVIALIWSVDQAMAKLRREHHRRSIIADAGAELDRSLDYRVTLSSVAELAVRRISDWCAVDLVEEGRLQRLAIAHVDPSKIELLQELERRYPPGPDVGVERVMRTGQPLLVPEITPERIKARAVDDAHRALLERLGFRSYICVPIRRDEMTIGVLSVATAESGRSFGPEDLAMVSALADRAALAIENARLFREVQEQRARAEQASRTKDQFLAMLGHELRNPLAPIRTALELMELRNPEVLERERTVIDRQIRQLGRLVDDLLDIARITSGRIELHEQPTELAEIVTKAVEMTDPLIEERGHSLRVEVPGGLIISADPLRMTQVVGNLLTNAAKYTERGGHIEVLGAREGAEVVLRVRDNGIGIEPGMLPRIFEMFVQESQAIDRARGGLGLGLAIVRNLVKLHRGDVTASSEGTGKGSEFVVRIPALEEAVAPAPAERPAAHAGSVLVVDDNPDALDMLADALERRGFATARAHDGPSALAVATRLHPQVALLDIGLPVMDGYELARRLRELDAGVKLIAVTGYSQPGDFARTKEAGFAAHLVKPISLDAVQAEIERLAS